MHYLFSVFETVDIGFFFHFHISNYLLNSTECDSVVFKQSDNVADN